MGCLFHYFAVPEPVVPVLPAVPPAGGVIPAPVPAPVPAAVLPVVPLAPEVVSAPVPAPLLQPPSINISATAENMTRAPALETLMIDPFSVVKPTQEPENMPGPPDA